MLRFPDRGAHRPIMAAMAFVGALSTADVQAGPFHHNHYHGGSWGRPGVNISIGGGGGGFNYYSAGSAFYGPGLSVYSGPAYPGPIIAPPVYVPPYGYGYGYGYGYPAYGYGYGVTSPYVYPTIPDTIERAPAPSGSFSLPMVDQGFGQGQAGRTIGRDPLNIRPNVQTHPKLVKPSTPEAQLRALRLQDMGDQQLRMLRYSNAAQAYEKAIEAAEDIPDPRFRLGIAFVGKGRLVEAASAFEEAAALDPQLPARAPKLDDLLGTENRLSKEQLKETVAQWANQDVRDTRRLFLLGVIMHLDGDVRSREIFEAAVKIGGATPGLQAFLNTQPGNANPAAPVPVPAQQPGQVPGAAPVLPRGGVPLPPAPNLGNPTGPLPPAPVPSKAPPSTIPVPPLPTPSLPPPGLPQPSLPVPDPGGAGVDLPLPVAPAPSGAAPSRSEPMPTPAVTPISGTLPTLPPLSP